MRSLLQSKLGVGLMFVAAVTAMVWRFMPASLGTATPVAAREETVVEADGATVITTNSPSRFLTQLGNWKQLFPNSDLKRDPFVFPKRAEAAPQAEPEDPAMPALVKLDLQAVSIQGGRAFAVINRQILKVGDQISGYTVERIDQRQVALNAESGKRVLEIRFDEAAPVASEEPATDPAPPTPSPR